MTWIGLDAKNGSILILNTKHIMAIESDTSIRIKMFSGEVFEAEVSKENVATINKLQGFV
ncbi:MAG TPA: hypothetical protein PKI66_04850 [Methanobacteriaceae archaeon]|nr:hypothetical protein [Methanobacteriaceae archaeon]